MKKIIIIALTSFLSMVVFAKDSKIQSRDFDVIDKYEHGNSKDSDFKIRHARDIQEGDGPNDSDLKKKVRIKK